MAQTKRVSVLTSVHDRRLNEPMVQDNSIMRRLNGQPRGKRAGRLSSDSAQTEQNIILSCELVQMVEMMGFDSR